MTGTRIVIAVIIISWLIFKIIKFRNILSYGEFHPPVPVIIHESDDGLAKTFENEIERCNAAALECMAGTEPSYRPYNPKSDATYALNQKFHKKRGTDAESELSYSRFLV